MGFGLGLVVSREVSEVFFFRGEGEKNLKARLGNNEFESLAGKMLNWMDFGAGRRRVRSVGKGLCPHRERMPQKRGLGCRS